MTDNLKELLVKQKQIHDEIDRAAANFQKDSKERKESYSWNYLQKKISQVQSAFQQLELNNQIIKIHPEAKESQYVKEKAFERISTIYQTLIREYEEILKTVEPDVNTSVKGDVCNAGAKSASDSQTKDLLVMTSKFVIRKNCLLRNMEQIGIKLEKGENLDRDHPRVRSLADSFHAVQLALEEERDFEGDFVVIEEEYKGLMDVLYDQERSNKHAESNLVKLKPIEIPVFYGEARKWISFKDLFESMVHKNRKLDNTQRMQYLKTSVKGEAEKLLMHLHAVGDNYTEAWKLLSDRYDNERRIMQSTLETLLNLPVLYAESSKMIKNMHDTVKECIHDLKNVSVKQLIAFMLERKLDKETHERFLTTANQRELTELEELLSFLETRFQTLEAIEHGKGKQKPLPAPRMGAKLVHTAVLHCAACNGTHRINECEQFRRWTISRRLECVKFKNLCYKCLSSGHNVNNCRLQVKCGVCGLGHNTFLHYGNRKVDDVVNITKTNTTTNKKFGFGVLLATAVVKVRDQEGQWRPIVALVDQGSQSTLITKRAVALLQLEGEKTLEKISGIGPKGSIARCKVMLIVKPRYPSSFQINTEALVLDKLTTLVPEKCGDNIDIDYMKQLVLADPDFGKRREIDIILGADVFGEILLQGMLKEGPGKPLAQETEFGWILSGRTNASFTNKLEKVTLVTNVEVDETVKKFWEIEEVADEEKQLSTEEQRCEDHFVKTHERNESGRYVVRLPFKENAEPLGRSRNIAVATLLQMEKKFERDPKLKEEYVKCLNEYLDLGHMVEAVGREEDRIENGHGCCYLPHHAVVKRDRITTKVRVVFDASRKTTSKASLNNVLMVGPTIQDDLFNILVRWRQHRVVFNADAEKMYRQVLIHKEDADFQRIVWRRDKMEPIKDYCLNTVTFGVASAPFMAVRVLKQLATDEMTRYPLGAKILENDFYVDDVLSGADDIEEAKVRMKQLNDMLLSGGFQLRKWTSNKPELLQGIQKEFQESMQSVEVDRDEAIKTLGMQWCPRSDTFIFNVKMNKDSLTDTKRSYLSEAAKLFDPLGLVAPVVIVTKIMFQGLWQRGLDWDDKLPDDIQSTWNGLKLEMNALEHLKIPRWVGISRAGSMELHGFADASEVAYAAAVYVRTCHTDGKVDIQLIAAKTKVAPLKKKTLPKLELLGATLLVELMYQVEKALQLTDVIKYAWSDSMITLGWINGEPSDWKTFVSNRVSKIQRKGKNIIWRHVSSKNNPADVASRGIRPSEIGEYTIWWNGPEFLKRKM